MTDFPVYYNIKICSTIIFIIIAYILETLQRNVRLESVLKPTDKNSDYDNFFSQILCIIKKDKEKHMKPLTLY